MYKKGITVYCGSSAGVNPRWEETARELGTLIGQSGLPLYYGGGRMGLMSAVGSAVIEAGGTAIAVIPRFMVDRGWNDPQASETVITDGMHPRKAFMARHCIGAIALPGGVGTFEELFELITWRQLGLYKGNIVLADIDGYYRPLIDMLKNAATSGFLPQSHLNLFKIAHTASEAFDLACQTTETSSIAPKF